MDGNPTGPRAHGSSMARPAPQQILVCTACTHKGDACGPGFHLLKQLRAAVATAGLGERFEISGTARLAACVPDHGEPCVVGWRATEKATWLFGDIHPDQPLDDLVDFARTAAALDDGRLIGCDQPQWPCQATLARMPAAMIVTREGPIQ